METKFHLDFEWEDAPGVRDPALANTWARLEIRVGDEVVTRFFSESSRSVRDGVHGSLLPLAMWVGECWWSLLHEPAPSASALAPLEHIDPRALDWRRRHDITFGRQGMSYPNLIIHRQDDAVHLRWGAARDSHGAPGRFIASGDALIDPETLKVELSRLLDAVIERTEGVDTGDVSGLVESRDLIQGATPSEEQLLARLGAMGIDPYDERACPPDLEQLLTELDFSEAVVSDLLAATRSRELAADADSVRAMQAALPDSEAPFSFPTLSSLPSSPLPYRAGYLRAQRVREALGVDDTEVLGAELTTRVSSLGFGSSWGDYAGKNIEGVVHVNGGVAVSARERSPTARRFLEARALHHALFATPHGGERLITRGGDWQQASSRAFAAELLAPASELARRTDGRVDWEEASALAEAFNVHPQVIWHQLDNHGLS